MSSEPLPIAGQQRVLMFNPQSILAFTSPTPSSSTLETAKNTTTTTTTNLGLHYSNLISKNNVHLLRARRARMISAREKQVQRKGHPRRNNAMESSSSGSKLVEKRKTDRDVLERERKRRRLERVGDEKGLMGFVKEARGSGSGSLGSPINLKASPSSSYHAIHNWSSDEDSCQELDIADSNLSPRTPTSYARRRIHQLHRRARAFSTFRGSASNASSADEAYLDDGAGTDADVESEIESELQSSEEEDDGSDIEMDMSEQLNGEEEMEVDFRIASSSPQIDSRTSPLRTLMTPSRSSRQDTSIALKRKRTNSSTPPSPSPAPRARSSAVSMVLKSFPGVLPPRPHIMRRRTGISTAMFRTATLEGALERIRFGVENSNKPLVFSEDSASDADMVLSDADWLRLERYSHVHLMTAKTRSSDSQLNGASPRSLAGKWVAKLKGIDLTIGEEGGMSMKWKRKLVLARRFTRSTRWKTPTSGISPEVSTAIRAANGQRVSTMIKYNAALTLAGYTDVFFSSLREHWTKQHFAEGSWFRIVWDGISEQQQQGRESRDEWKPDQPLVVLPGQARTYLEMLEFYEAVEPEAEERRIIRRAGNHWILQRSSSALLEEFTQRCNARKAAARSERRAAEQRARDEELIQRRREDREREDWERERMLAMEREERCSFEVRQREMERVEEERRILQRWESEREEISVREIVVAPSVSQLPSPPPPPPMYQPPTTAPPIVTPPPRFAALPLTSTNRPAAIPLTPVPAYTGSGYGPSSPPPPPPYNAQSGFEVVDLGDIEDELGLDDFEEEDEDDLSIPVRELPQLSLEEMQAAEMEMHGEQSGSRMGGGRCVIM